MTLDIRTNRQPRNLLAWHELTEKERIEFDWLETPDQQMSAQFFRYRGWTYCLDQFMSATNMFPRQWHGYHSDSYSSGVLISIADDDDQVICATYST